MAYDPILVRTLCGEINRTQDDEKVMNLTSLLHAVINDDLEEIRIRMAFLRQKYSMIFEQSKAAD